MKKSTYTVILLLCMHNIAWSQVGVGITTPDDSAIFQIESTTEAFSTPRMTNTEMLAISTPLDGAMVCSIFNTSLSITNMSSGNNKYIIAETVNGSLVAYLVRDYSNPLNTDYCFTSNYIMHPINTNDEVKIRYVLNNGGTPLNAKFANIGITKLN